VSGSGGTLILVDTTGLTLSPDLRALVTEIAAFLRARDVTAYATGGFMRDAVVGAAPGDVDISVDGDPLALGPALASALGGTYFPLDEARRHARVLVQRHRVHVDLLPLRGSIEEDLRSRDYTVDAMGAPLGEVARGEATIVDPAGGMSDLRAGLVRCVSEQALRDDPLRVLRGPRIAIERGFTIEDATANAIRRHATSLPSSAPERQRDEIMQMMRTDRAGAAFRLLDDLALLTVVMPEVDVMRGVEQPKEHHWDVLGHAFACTEMLDDLLTRSEPSDSASADLWCALWDELTWWQDRRDYFDGELVPGSTRYALTKLCGFLHDIGKPETKSFDNNGRMRFFGHSDSGAAIAGGLMRRLRFSTRETAFVQRMIEAHLRPVQMAQQGAPSDRAIFRFFRATGDAGIATLFLSLADHLATVGPRRNVDAVREHARLVAYVIHQRVTEQRVTAPARLVRGDDLIAALGIEPGPEVGRLLSEIEEAQAAGEVTTREEALALARKRVDR
jgi:poly(A) polymerase